MRATLLVALLLTGCATGGGSSATGAASTEPSVSPAGTDAGAMPLAPVGIPDAVWTAIITDLAQRSDAPRIDPTVVRAEEMTWNDGSLGCPDPDQMYTQALVDGYQVVLELDGERYDYRVGSGTDVRLCENSGLEGGG
jgi:hypothetical protein